eukprot:1463756-Pleurochrysis_carterae.AAC.1
MSLACGGAGGGDVLGTCRVLGAGGEGTCARAGCVHVQGTHKGWTAAIACSAEGRFSERRNSR